jgi:hypothetical protein
MQQLAIFNGLRIEEIENEIRDAESSIGELLLEAKTADELFGLRPVQDFYEWAQDKFNYSRVWIDKLIKAEGKGDYSAFKSNAKDYNNSYSSTDTNDWDGHVTNSPVTLNTDNPEWYTPPEYIEAAREVMGRIDLDPASCAAANQTVQADIYWTKEDDGLSYPWVGRVWLNPPYGKACRDFVAKLVDEYESGHLLSAILLVNGTSFETAWFQPLYNYPICFHNGRINFIPGASDSENGATHGSVFVYFGPDKAKFINRFKQFGRIMEAIDD